MRQNQKRLSCDVTVLCSADCWTNHKLLRARLQLKTSTRPAKSKTRRRYDVAALGDENVRKKYNKCVREAIVGKWKNMENGVRKWEIMRDGMVSAAESVLGWENRRQPDWFQENITVLQQLITKRNKLFSQWMKTHHHSDRQRYVAQRRAVSTTRDSIERAAHVLDRVTSEWRLKMNMLKTKLMVAGVQREEDLWPIYIIGEPIEAVKGFKYLRAIIEPHGGIERDAQDRVARAWRRFEASSKPVFRGDDLSLLTKRLVYLAVVLGVLLCGAETWANKRVTTRTFEAFHNRCLRSILGITKE